MVKVLFAALFLFTFLYAQNPSFELVETKIKAILDSKTYRENQAFVKIVFSPPEKFIINDRVNSVKVIETLKDNGLLDLFFNKPTEIELQFKTNGAPLFFVKIVGDTLRNIGYYRYVTKSSSYNESEFIWSVSIVSEYAADPMILQRELLRNGCSIVDIERQSPTKWLYTIDMLHAKLDVDTLEEGYEKRLRRSLFPFWLDVSKIRKLRIVSKGRNNWYPNISYYDNHLHLVKVLQRDRKSYEITLVIPKDAYYIKIADIYTMKNIKDTLILKPKGSR